jgi:hypothetical protein
MTAIEQALYSNGAAHWVTAFNLLDRVVTITSHPCDRPQLLTLSTFDHATMLSLDDSYADDGDRSFPWDIIGFDSQPLSNGRWHFCLHTDKIEYCFEAKWPAVRRAG